MKNYLIFVIFFIAIIVTDAVYYGIVKANAQDTKLFNEYPNTALSDVIEIRKELTADYQECIRICEFEEANCESINVINLNNGSFSCHFFATAEGTFDKRNDTIYISKREPKCNGYCAELSYMDLCGKCKCKDKCNSLYSHYCDCTDALEEQKNCKTIRDAGFFQPALYNIRLDGGGKFKGYCDTQNDGTFWLTMMKRMVINDRFSSTMRTIDDYMKGFGRPHDAVYWMGLNRIKNFTQSSNTILRVVVTAHDRTKWYGEYEGFKVDGQYNYTYTSYHTDCCQVDNGFAEVSQPFSQCSNGDFWFDKCTGIPGYPTEIKKIRWGRTSKEYVRVVLLLRHGTLKTENKLTGYSQWSDFGTCTLTCGSGTQTKTRSCDSPTAKDGGKDCSSLGPVVLTGVSRSCNTQHCPVHGGYSGWYASSSCTVKCGGGTQPFIRTCNNPTPAYGGNDCDPSEKTKETRSCNTHACRPRTQQGAREYCKSIGYTVGYVGSGSLVCHYRTYIGSTYYCARCAYWRIIVWKDGGGDPYCSGHSYGTAAGAMYGGHTPCGCQFGLPYCGNWDGR